MRAGGDSRRPSGRVRGGVVSLGPRRDRIEDNGYAISVPIEVQTAGHSISKLVAGFPDLYFEEVEGCDLSASFERRRTRARTS